MAAGRGVELEHTQVPSLTTIRLISQERHGLHARNLERLPAALIFAAHLVIEQNHVARGFGEFRPVTFIRIAGKAVPLSPDDPS